MSEISRVRECVSADVKLLPLQCSRLFQRRKRETDADGSDLAAAAAYRQHEEDRCVNEARNDT